MAPLPCAGGCHETVASVLANSIALTLNHGAFTTQAVTHSRQAGGLLREWKPHLIVVDVQLAEGLLTVDELPIMESHVGCIPVIGLTRSGDLETKLLAIDRGVDDILTLPFTPDELVAKTFMVMPRGSWRMRNTERRERSG